jgi:hypothetical protein
MTTIQRPCDQIRLADFKESVKLFKTATSTATAAYLYRFKTLDPEFGVLKEEIADDHKLLPAFESRIVAWIESYPI